MKVLIAILSILLFSTVSFAKNQSSQSLHGQYVNVPGGKIYVESYGKSKPVVVFLAGYSDGLYTWRRVAPEISKFAHVVVYDRLDITGMNDPESHGRSIIKKSRLEKPLTGKEIIHNLSIVLKKLKLSPPYIIVGHSYGGLLAQYFIRKYPNQIKSAVFIDSATEQMLRSLQRKRKDAFVLDLPPKNVDYYPEGLGMAETLNQFDKLPPFPNKPIIVLGATYHYQTKAKHEERLRQSRIHQNELASLSPQSQLLWVVTGHYIQLQRPWVVIAAVKEAIQLKYFHVCKEWAPWQTDICEKIKKGLVNPNESLTTPRGGRPFQAK